MKDAIRTCRTSTNMAMLTWQTLLQHPSCRSSSTKDGAKKTKTGKIVLIFCMHLAITSFPTTTPSSRTRTSPSGTRTVGRRISSGPKSEFGCRRSKQSMRIRSRAGALTITTLCSRRKYRTKSYRASKLSTQYRTRRGRPSSCKQTR